MAEQFYTILTAIGKAKIANSAVLGTSVDLTKLKVGDGLNNNYYEPTEDQLVLKHQVWEGNINNISVSETNPNWIILETIIPSDIGGFTIREAGVFDSNGDMIAIGKYPQTYKPATEQGSSKDLLIRMILEVSNTESITLKVDPTVILATKKDIITLQNQINGNMSVNATMLNGIKIDLRLSDDIVGTTQIPTYSNDGNIIKIIHKDSLGNILRTDTFTYTDTLITETRTLSTCETVTLKHYFNSDGSFDRTEVV